MKRRFQLVVVLLAALLPFAHSGHAAVGGGTTAAGLTGSYYATADLSGPIAFTRRDVRVNFDWGANYPVGGATEAPYANFPRHGFSARWEGAVLPRFSEKYTFIVEASDGARLWVNNTLLVDSWNTAGVLHSAPVSLITGKASAIKLEYHHGAGNGKIKLRWSSTSTPEEILDPVSTNGLNIDKNFNDLFADDVKYCSANPDSANPLKLVYWYQLDPVTKFGRRDAKNNLLPAAEDADHQLAGDGYLQFSVFGDWSSTVTDRLTFNGKADVTFFPYWHHGLKATFTVNGVDYLGELPAGTGYDPTTNTTTALIKFPNGIAPCIGFLNSRRTAQSAMGTGITNLHLYRPTSFGGATPCALGTFIHPLIRTPLENYTTLRLINNGFADERNWADRTRPAYPGSMDSPTSAGGTSSKPCWEDMIMLANETGKDLYCNLSVRDTPDYITKLAYLIKYGSDGVNPYTSPEQWPTSGPLYPPLNPNLCFYFEFGNEVWNWGFSMNSWIYQDSKDAVDLSHGKQLDHVPSNCVTAADGAIIDYDGNGFGSWQRWQALRTVQYSELFRAVFGDAGMGSRIRPLIYDQYGFYGMNLGQFIDNYFNKADPTAKNPDPPHPTSYYVWGGGGAIYYGSQAATDTSFGNDPDIQPKNGSFETPALADGAYQAAPAGADWTFTGTAGIYRNIARSAAISALTAGTPLAPPAAKQYGFKFTVGANPIAIYDVGRWVIAGNSGQHTIHLYKSDGGELSSTQLALNGTTAGQYRWAQQEQDDWPWRPHSPLILTPNSAYYLLCDEKDDQYSGTVSVTAADGITINCPASTDAGGHPLDGPAGSNSYGLVNCRFAPAPMGELGFVPDAIDGSQVAYIGGTGSMSQTINFTKTGEFALAFNAASKQGMGNSVKFTLDGQSITPQGGIDPDFTPSATPWGPGGWGRPGKDLGIIAWGAAPFAITTPGPHTLTITGAGTAAQYLYFDKIILQSEDGLYGPNCAFFPGGGQANGQDSSGNFIGWLKAQSDWTSVWGLHYMAYEGAWSVGGDFDQKPFYNWCKFLGPRTITANGKALHVFQRLGGATAMYYYNQWPPNQTANAMNFALVKSVVQLNDQLPVEADNGQSVPATLTPPMVIACDQSRATRDGKLLAAGGWLSWNIIAPVSGQYQLTLKTNGAGGALLLLADDRLTVATGIAGADITGVITLTKGMHAIKVRSTSATQSSVLQLVVTMPGAPPVSTLVRAIFNTDGSLKLSWLPVAGATGYIIGYGAAPGAYSTTVNAGSVTEYTLTGLDSSSVYFVAVCAYNAKNSRGFYTNEMRLAHRSTDPPTVLDFEELPLTPGNGTSKLTSKGFTFTPLAWGFYRIDQPAGATHLLHQQNGVRIQRADGRSFDLYSLDGLAEQPGNSAVITGYDETGQVYSAILNQVATKKTIVLGWVHLLSVQVHWHVQPDGGGGETDGFLDNVLINKTGLGDTMTVVLPTVSILAPRANEHFSAPAMVALTALPVLGTMGAVARVEYSQGADKIGEVTGAPYTFNWGPLPAGSFTITAKVTDSLGYTAVSAPVTFSSTFTPQLGAFWAFHSKDGKTATNAVSQCSWPNGAPKLTIQNSNATSRIETPTSPTFTNYNGDIWSNSVFGCAWNGSGPGSFTLQCDTRMLSKLAVRFDYQMDSGDGHGETPGYVTAMQYSLNGTTWTAIPHAPAFSWTKGGVWSMDISSLPALDNQPTVYLKWTLAVPAGGDGCFRIANLQLTAGSSAPRPSMIAISPIVSSERTGAVKPKDEVNLNAAAHWVYWGDGQETQDAAHYFSNLKVQTNSKDNPTTANGQTESERWNFTYNSSSSSAMRILGGGPIATCWEFDVKMDNTPQLITLYEGFCTGWTGGSSITITASLNDNSFPAQTLTGNAINSTGGLKYATDAQTIQVTGTAGSLCHIKVSPSRTSYNTFHLLAGAALGLIAK